MPQVTFQYDGQKRVVEATHGQTILQIALENGIPMEHACGGNGFCTTCMCEVQEGMDGLSPRSDREENMGITKDPERLSCQANVEGDVSIQIPD
jgi:ferredoxin, 2Fe-2S